MARAIWKGVLRFAGVKIPVRLFSAVEDRDIHFRLLHEKDRTPVRQQLVDPTSGQEVSYERVQKAYEIARGVFVILQPDELADVEPGDSRDIDVARFVAAGKIGHLWYERPYYLGPERGAERDYAALAKALADADKEGVARWVMRDREYAGALRASGPYLVLIALRHDDEVIAPAELEPPGGGKPAAKELALAEQLVAALEKPFDPTDYADEYRARVQQLIAAKSKGKKPKRARAVRKAEPASLERALAASLAHAGRERKRA